MPGFVFRVAELFEVAAVAFWFAGDAHLAAMVNELVREGDPVVLRDNLHQLLLDLLRRVAFGQAEAMGDAEDMRVHDNAFGFAKRNAKNDVGGLACCAGDGDELSESLRNLALEFGDDLSSRALDRFGLVAVEAGGADEGLKLGQRCFGHCCWGREALEEFRRHHVHAHVSALGGEDCRDKQFPG